MRWRGPFSLRTLLIGQFVAVAAVAVCITVVLMLQWRLPVAREQTRTELDRVADLAVLQLERTLDGSEALARALAQVVQGRLFQGQPLDGDSEFNLLLNYLASGSGLYDAIYLIDNDFKIRATALNGDIVLAPQDVYGNDLSGVEVLQRARLGWDLVWSDQFLSPMQARPVVAVVVPLVGGMVMLEMSVERLAGFARDKALRDNLLLLVVDGKGELVAAPDTALVRARTNLANLGLVRAAINNQSAFDTLVFAGQGYTGTARHSDRLGWGMVVAYPQALIDAPVRAAVSISAITLALAFGVGVLMAIALARRLDLRIGETLDYAAAIARGDYRAQARPSGLREIERIQASLANMGATIEARERALAAQERQFRELVENTADLVLYFDAQGVITYSNPSANHTLAAEGDSLVGQTVVEHLVPAAVEPFERWLAYAATAARNTHQAELVMRHTSGRQHTVAWSATVERDGQGRLALLRCIGLDVTRQRAAQEALRRSEARLRAIVEGSPSLAIQWYDRDGRVLDWNPASETLFGFTREEAMGKTLEQLIYTPQQHSDFLAMLREVERSGRFAGPYEAQVNHRDGHTRGILSTTFQIPGDNEQPLFVCMDLDITDRQRAEAELKLSQRRFQTMFDANPVAVAVMRREGMDFRYESVNDAWLKLMGYERDQVVGRLRTELSVMANSNTQWPALVQRLERERIVALNDVPARRADGSVFMAEGRVGLVQSEEGEIAIYSLHDVTEVRRMQRDLQALNAELEDRIAQRTQSLTLANTELEQALMTVQMAQERLVAQQDRLVQSEKLASLGSLVAGIAHELNTPIGNGLMAVTTLQDRVRGFESKLQTGLKRSDLEALLQNVRTGCEIAARNIDRASHLVASFKQVAVDQTSDQRRPFEFKEVVDEILLTLQPTLKRTSHRVNGEVPQGLMMDSYPGALGQVLTNLIQNALVHGLEGLEDGQIEVRAERQGDAVELRVADNGRGIPEAVHKQVFDPFFTTKLGQGGSGLGLPIVRNMVTGVLGGDITFHNRASGGVEFVVRLPLKAPEAPEKTAPQAAVNELPQAG